MNRDAEDHLPIAKADVEHLFGKCLLRLQHYEHRVKTILADHRRSISTAAIAEDRAAPAANTNRQTLGVLVGQMMDSFIVAGELERPTDLADADPADDGVAMTMLIQIGLRPEDFAKVEADLKELVALRNRLVHHFLEEHDLCSLFGCEGGRSALVEASTQIDRAMETLANWETELVQMKSALTQLLSRAEIRAALTGETIPWPITTIVRALREAESALARDGWAPIRDAAHWITKRYPNERPDGYQCRSWKQVVHEAGCFDLNYRSVNGQREAWYRSRTSKSDLP